MIKGKCYSFLSNSVNDEILHLRKKDGRKGGIQSYGLRKLETLKRLYNNNEEKTNIIYNDDQRLSIWEKCIVFESTVPLLWHYYGFCRSLKVIKMFVF